MTLGFVACPTIAESSYTYSRQTEFTALRVSYSDLQAVLDKTEALMQAANGRNIHGREVLWIEGHDRRIEIAGHNFAKAIALPDHTEAFHYYALPPYGFVTTAPSDKTSETVTFEQPITEISIELTRYRRSLAVSGTSPDQVHAVFAALRDDLDALSSPIGLNQITLLVFVFMGSLAVMAAANATLEIVKFKSRRRRDWKVLLAATSGLFAISIALFSDVISGFSAYRGDASFMVRYAPQVGFWASVIGVIAPLCSLWRESGSPLGCQAICGKD